MTNDERLERIEARAKGLGWHRRVFHNAVNSLARLMENSVHVTPPVGHPKWLTAAEALLSMWEPGAVVDRCPSYGDDERLDGDVHWYVRGKDPDAAPDGMEYVLVLRDKLVEVGDEQVKD